jgi:benzoylformate decarboxylase
MATVREVTFDLLRDLGMTTIFGNPGSTELPFLQDFPEDFRYVLALQEASALGMADGYAQGTGQAAFVNLHTGPGLGNAMGAMVTAWHNRTPLVVTAGQQDRRHLILDPMLSANLVELAEPYVKRSHEPERAEDVPREILRAYHTAMQAPRGPVFVSIPMNDWDVEAEPPPSHEVYHEPAPDPEGIEKFAQVLAEAERPAIVAGAWVDRKGAFYDTVALAEKLNAAVWEAPLASRAGFPQTIPSSRVASPPPRSRFPSSSTTTMSCSSRCSGLPLLPLRPRPRRQRGHRGPPHHRRSRQGRPRRLGTEPLRERGLRRAPAPRDAAGEAGPPRPARPRGAGGPRARDADTACLPDAHPRGSLAGGDGDLRGVWFSRGTFHEYVRPGWPGAYFNAASGALGYAMPAAVGYKLAMPDTPVVCLIGDGSSMYSNQALWTAAQYGANVVFVIVDNKGYYILKGFRDAIGIDDTVPGLDVPDLDLVKLAESMGVRGETVEDPDTLTTALERGFAAKWPYLINVMVEPEVPDLPK